MRKKYYSPSSKCAVYLRVRLFLIYTTVSFFKTFSHLPVCVLKIFSIFKKNKKKKKKKEKKRKPQAQDKDKVVH